VAPLGSFALIHSGKGNIRSLVNALDRIGVDHFIAKSAQDFEGVRGIIFPGVGSFGALMGFLEDNGLTRGLIRAVGHGTPYLGICVGMQVLFQRSEEFGCYLGLGILEGDVVQLKRRDPSMKIPHVGWNRVSVTKEAWPDLSCAKKEDGEFFYFTHSFVCRPKGEGVHMGFTQYFGEFVSLVMKENIIGCQFHPERSGVAGLAFLEWFSSRFAPSRRSV
jgi:glutamine amidotransferase